MNKPILTTCLQHDVIFCALKFLIVMSRCTSCNVATTCVNSVARLVVTINVRGPETWRSEAGQHFQAPGKHAEFPVRYARIYIFLCVYPSIRQSVRPSFELEWKLEYSLTMSSYRSSSTFVPIYLLRRPEGDVCVAGNTCALFTSTCITITLLYGLWIWT